MIVHSLLKNKHTKIIYSYVISGFAGKAISLMIPFLVTPFLLKNWGIPAYGEWVFINSAAVSLMFFDLGISSYLINALSQIDKTDNIPKISNSYAVILFSSLILLLLSIVLFVIFYFNYQSLSKYAFVILISSTILFTNIISKIRLSYNQGNIQNLFDSLMKIVPYAILCIFSQKYNWIYSQIVFFSIYISIAIFNMINFARSNHTLFDMTFIKLNDAIQIIRDSRQYFYIQILYYLIYSYDNIIYDYFIGSKAYATLTTHKLASDVFISLISLLTAIVWPITNQLFKAKNYSQIRFIFKRIQIIILSISIIFSMIYYKSSNFIISYLSHGKIESQDTLVILISISTIFLSLNSLQLNTAYGLMAEKVITRMFLVFAICNVILRPIVVSNYGISGGLLLAIILQLFILNIPIGTYISKSLTLLTNGNKY